MPTFTQVFGFDDSWTIEKKLYYSDESAKSTLVETITKQESDKLWVSRAKWREVDTARLMLRVALNNDFTEQVVGSAGGHAWLVRLVNTQPELAELLLDNQSVLSEVLSCLATPIAELKKKSPKGDTKTVLSSVIKDSAAFTEMLLRQQPNLQPKQNQNLIAALAEHRLNAEGMKNFVKWANKKENKAKRVILKSKLGEFLFNYFNWRKPPSLEFVASLSPDSLQRLQSSNETSIALDALANPIANAEQVQAQQNTEIVVEIKAETSVVQVRPTFVIAPEERADFLKLRGSLQESIRFSPKTITPRVELDRSIIYDISPSSTVAGERRNFYLTRFGLADLIGGMNSQSVLPNDRFLPELVNTDFSTKESGIGEEKSLKAGPSV